MRIALVSIVALAFAGAAHAQNVDVPLIAVAGEATLSVAPDLALIEAGISSDGKTAREAAEANNAAMGKVLLAMKSAGIEDKNLQTQRLSLQPVYSQRSNNAPNVVVTGYRASNRVTVRLREMARVASTIDLAVGAGANEIGGVSFTVAQPSKLLDDARTQAIADARRKAEIYARAVGVELGAPLSVKEQGATSPAPMYRQMAADMAASAPVAPGEETLRISIAVTWAIKPVADSAKPAQ